MSNDGSRVLLGDVCTPVRNQASHGVLPYVGLEDIEPNTGRLTGVPASVRVKSSTFLFSPQHVLYGRLRPYLNKVLAPDFAGHCSTEIIPLKPSATLSRQFLRYWFLSQATVDKINATCTGSRMPRASLEAVLSLEIPVPSIDEQLRTVRILDKAFDGLATARGHALSNMESAREIFAGCLAARLADRRHDWQERSLLSLCAVFVDSAHRTPKYQAHGVPALRPRDVVNGRLRLDAAALVSDTEYDIQARRHKPAPGDIVYSRELSYGWAAILPEFPRVCLSQGMCLFRPSSKIDSDYLLYVLNGSIGRDQAERVAVGAAHPHINLGDIKSYAIPVPPPQQQTNLVVELRLIEQETQRLESLYQRKLAALDALKQSLLHQAFTGAL